MVEWLVHVFEGVGSISHTDSKKKPLRKFPSSNKAMPGRQELLKNKNKLINKLI